MAWLIEWSYPYDSESNTTVWSSEQDALKQACSEILDRIQSEWILSDQEYATEAKIINDFVAKGEFKKAMRHWNDCSLNCDSEYAMYWNARELIEETYQGSVPLIPQHLFNSQEDDEDSSDDEDVQDAEYEEDSYQAATPGATCRGPCKQHSEYAYANKRDGTYVCYSCRMMSDFFGNPIK